MAERRRGRLALTIFLGLLLVMVFAVVALYWYYRPLLLTGTGYAAHNACAVEHIAGRDDAANDLPPNPLVPYLRTTVDDDGSVTSSILGVIARQTAWYTEGHGCTLASKRPDLPAALPVDESHPFTTAEAPTDVDPELGAAVDATFDADPGTRAVVVVHDGEIVAERYAEGFTAETPQLGWSMSKSVTNLLVGRLVAEQGLDIHATDLRDEWADDDRSAITPDHLMRMTGGLAWDETYDLGTPITAMLYLESDMGAFVARQEQERPAGEFFEYSTGSTNLLCSVLAQQTGGDANLPRALLLAPLGLSSAQWEPDAAGTPVCGSYLWATPREWAAIGQFVLDDGTIDGVHYLPDGWTDEATAPTVPDDGDLPGYGAGWWLNDLGDGTLVAPDLPADAYWANGHDGQLLHVVPSEDLVVLRMGFSPGVPTSELGTYDLVAAAIRALDE